MSTEPLELFTETVLEEPDRAPKLTSRQVLNALRTRHPAREWVYVEEVRAGTGFDNATTLDVSRRKYIGGRGEKAVAQRIDAWALQLWNPGAIVAYEVKVSRADFRHEVADPSKRAFALLVSSEFYFVTPVKMVRLDEVPDDCGLIEVYEDGRIRTRRKAPSRPSVAPPRWDFVGSLLRNYRRQMYATGPGHDGQCGGHGYFEMVEHEWGKFREYRHFSATTDVWCAKEVGHAGECRRVRSAMIRDA